MRIKSDITQIQSYLEDSSSLRGANTEEVVFPQDYDDAAGFLRKHHLAKIPVTIQGGHTATTGSGLPFGQVLFSLEQLNRIIKIYPTDQPTVAVQAGVLLQDLQEAVNEQDYLYPPDSTEQTATIGGNISTNASGSRSFHYGSTRNYVERLKIITADGNIADLPRGLIKAKGDLFDCSWAGKRLKFERPKYTMPGTLKKPVKNAAGYYSAPNMDLIDLFIGSEGTLGLIVEAELKLVPLPQEPFDCVAFFKTEREAYDFLFGAKAFKPISLEFMDERSLDLLRPTYPNVPRWAKSAVLWEQTAEDLSGWAELLQKHNSSLDNVWYAEKAGEIKKIKDFRHGLPEAVNKIFQKSGFTKVSTDLAVPEEHIEEMLKFYDTELTKAGLPYVKFGHLGQNHLHVNLFSKTPAEYEKAKKQALVFAKKAVSLGGTVSAEHGIGKIKHDFLKIMYGEEGIKEMKRIRTIFDPNGILNPGNLFA